jgi:FlaG/FlaF family flagellin (archaellin)
VTPVLGNILLVAVVIVIALTLATFSFAFLEQTGTPTADAAFEYTQTPSGLEMTPTAISTDVIVELNGEQITTFARDSAGKTVLVPTAPGDTITVISKDEDRSVLVNKEIDGRSEIGNFIAYYTFEAGSGTILKDRSGNDNDGTIVGDPSPVGGDDNGLRFDGDDDYVDVTDISAPVDVSEFTVAVAYRPETGNKKQELVEHIDTDGSNWVLELKPKNADEYELAYSVDKAGGTQSGQFRVGPYQTDDRRVAVGTFDGSEYELYVDGNKKGSNSFDAGQSVSMGDMTFAKDAERDGDFLNGEIYELRLYYTAFDEEGVQRITSVMD